MNRREFLKTSAAVALAAPAFANAADEPKKAQVAITLDLEMARNFPTWETSHWDYEKGNLNDETKAYAVEAARRVKASGGVIHFFLVARALEQENVEWLRGLIKDGHRIGSHTYDHVYLLAQKNDDVQFRFKRCPWLVEGKKPFEVIRENVALATAAFKSRLGIDPAGIRAPGGFADGLTGREDIQRMLLDLGFKWISAKYPAHEYGEPGHAPTQAVLDDIVVKQAVAQPFKYPTGLLDIPMAPISDVGAFRNGRWPLESFKKAIRLGVEWAIERGAVYDYLCHPAVDYVADPKFETIDMICDLVKTAGDKAAIVDLDTVAKRIA